MKKVEFYHHQLGENEANAWRKVLDTLFLTLGPQVAAFEHELAQFLVRDRISQERYVIGTNSCSMGLLIALRALNVQAGDEVITTPMTFASTTNAILHLGGRPVLVDVEPTTGLIDPNRVRQAIGPKTKGILPVHLYGQLADMKALRALADAHGLFILEDSAHGVEIERDGIRPGDLGDAAVFSFYATKNMTSGDGGAIATRNVQLAERLRRLRNHGVSKAATDRHSGTYQHWDLIELGYKANLTDLDAALLRPQISEIEHKRKQREQCVQRYETLLPQQLHQWATYASPNHVPFLIQRRGVSSHHLFTIHPPVHVRDRVLTRLGELGIGTAVNYRAIHTLTYLSDLLKIPRSSLPIAEEIGDRTISLPLYPTLTEVSQDHVIQALVTIYNECKS